MAHPCEQKIEFRKPVEILELWRCKRLFEKGETTPQERHKPFAWTPFESPFGTIRNGKLQLAGNSIARCDTRHVQVIFLVSDHPANSNDNYFPAGMTCQDSPHALKLDIIKAEPRGNWPVTFSNPGFHQPQLDSFQVAELKPGEWVEIRANQKHDGYHQRMYIEYSYLMRRSGPFKEALVGEGPFLVEAPADVKVVDLRKLLW
ncbi:MAG: hypothetical protein EOO08_02940 [Chitinophagaceae bacterium]|nr:MAG: hypothetical protein EOO08_02940 [Chitinophagaceae bacterium]